MRPVFTAASVWGYPQAVSGGYIRRHCLKATRRQYPATRRAVSGLSSSQPVYRLSGRCIDSFRMQYRRLPAGSVLGYSRAVPGLSAGGGWLAGYTVSLPYHPVHLSSLPPWVHYSSYRCALCTRHTSASAVVRTPGLRRGIHAGVGGGGNNSAPRIRPGERESVRRARVASQKNQ